MQPSITLALMLASTHDTNSFDAAATFDVARVEITQSAPCAHVVALDSGGHFAGAVTLCADEAGRVDVDADFADDLYLSVRHDGSDKPTIESNGARESQARMNLMLGYLDPVQVQAGWGSCIMSAAGLVGAVVAISPIGVVASAWATGCDCVPLLDEEFAEIECPFW